MNCHVYDRHANTLSEHSCLGEYSEALRFLDSARSAATRGGLMKFRYLDTCSTTWCNDAYIGFFRSFELPAWQSTKRGSHPLDETDLPLLLIRSRH
jgi:hypothetical protein